MSLTTVSTFGAWIRTRRRTLGITQVQLGQRINYSAIAIRKLESGSRNCSEELAALLLSALAVPAQFHFAFMQSARTGVVEPALQQFEFDDDPSALLASGKPNPAAQSLSQYVQPTTQLFGREADIVQVLGLLQQPQTRLITLHGAPGVGKSRLAVEVLRRADAREWPDGQFFVPLAHIDHATLIPNAIANAMGIHEIPGRKWRETVAGQDVYQFVKDKRALLVLDNFEHLRDGMPFLTALLAATPSIKIVVTSRVSSKVPGEQLFLVNPLPILDWAATLSMSQIAQNESVGLFIARAQARRQSFRLTQDNARAVVTLCQILGGLPLALELAAVHIKLQTPEELLRQFKVLPVVEPNSHILTDSQPSTLQALIRGPRDMPQRHQTLSAAIQWSYDLLTPAAQSMFEQLSVFHAGFTREAAIAITQGSLETLEVLVSHSLVQVRTTSDQRIRFSLFEVLREFALIKLDARGETHSTRQRHAQYLASLLQHLDNNSPGPDELDSVEMISAEYANMRVALSWCRDHDLPTGFTLARYMNHYWVVNGDYYEGRAWTTQMLEAEDHDQTIPRESRAYLVCVGKMLYTDTPLTVIEEQLALFRRLGIKGGMAIAEGIIGWTQLRNSPSQAEQHLDFAIATLESDGRPKGWLSATLRMFRAVALYTMGRFTISEQLLKDAAQIHTQWRDGRGLAHIQNYLAWLQFAKGDYAKAAELAQQVLLLNQPVNDAYAKGRAHVTQAFAEIELSHWTQAKTSVVAGLRVVNEAGVETLKTLLLHAAGALAFEEGRIVDAKQLYLESLSLAQPLAQVDYIPLTLINLAQLAMGHVETDVNLVVQWLSAAITNARSVEYHLLLAYQARVDGLMTQAHEKLGRVQMEQALAIGRPLSLDAAIVLAQTATESIAVEVEAG